MINFSIYPLRRGTKSGSSDDAGVTRWKKPFLYPVKCLCIYRLEVDKRGRLMVILARAAAKIAL